MRAARSYWIALAVLYVAVLAVVATFALVVAMSLPAAKRAQLELAIAASTPALIYASVILLFICGGGLSWLFRRYPLAAKKLADQTRTLVAGDAKHRVVAAGGPEFGELASVINRFAERYARLEQDLEARSAEARARVEEERNRFAALMSELTEGVLVCNSNGRILLYNARAASVLGQTDSAPARADYTPLGLGRSVFALLDRDQVAHALDKLHQQTGRKIERAHTQFVTTAASGAPLRVKVAPFFSAQQHMAGMVFTLDDVSGLLERETQRLGLLQALATALRAPLANLRAAAENLVAFPRMEDTRRGEFVDIVAAESRVLTERINTALREYADALKSSLALEDMRIVDLLTVVQRRIGQNLDLTTRIEDADDDIWIKVDSFAFVQAIVFLAAKLHADYGVRDLRFRAAASERFVELDLVWTGAIVGSDALSLWETEPMRVGASETPLTLKDVLDRHGGEVWSQADRPRQRAWFRFLIPLGEPVDVATPHAAALESRPEYYDFDLFERIETTGAIADRPLVELSYTVFDTETTGLEPSAGDEIISIGAVRVVNNRLLKNEVFEQLVDPRRPIARDSIRIHGIDSRALAGQPSITEVLPGFHRFCEDTVLVAHNAAFDMRFLELKEAAAGVRFDHPVLDTLLLSAVVHPSFENHDLDVIAERVGVHVIGRHTALGDAMVTGEIFLKLLPLLAGRGIVTLGQAVEASRSTYHARLRY